MSDNRGGVGVVGERKDELERNRPNHSRKLQKTNIRVSSTMVLSTQTFSMERKRDIEPWGLVQARKDSEEVDCRIETGRICHKVSFVSPSLSPLAQCAPVYRRFLWPPLGDLESTPAPKSSVIFQICTAAFSSFCLATFHQNRPGLN